MKCAHCDEMIGDITEHLYSVHGYSYGDAATEADYQYQSANEEHPSNWIREDL